MGRGIASFGGFFAFAAFVLLLLASLSTPIIDDINFLKYEATNGDVARFGAWGYCLTSNGDKVCTSKRLGYEIGDLLDSLSNTDENFRGAIEKSLTYALVLNPVAAGMSFIAFLFSMGGGVCSGILGSIWAFFSFLVTAVALGVDLGLFIAARHRLNDYGGEAKLSNATWMVVGATVAILIASFTICCGGIRERRSHRFSNVSTNEAQPVYTTQSPWHRRLFARRGQY